MRSANGLDRGGRGGYARVTSGCHPNPPEGFHPSDSLLPLRGSFNIFIVERGECLRKKLGIPSGTRHEMCYAVHAEQNAIIQAAKLGVNIDGSTLYCTHQPCILCAKMIVNAGIVRVVYHSGYPDDFALDIFEEAGVKVECYTE